MTTVDVIGTGAGAGAPAPVPVGGTELLDVDEVGGRVERTELPGGLRVLTETMPGVLSATLGIWVGVGSRDETPELGGASHFLEHLLFKGTRTRSALEIATAIDAVGGEMNAFTAKEHTCYYANVLASDLPLAVTLLGDLVTDALITAPDLESERTVVLEEIAMRDDEPADAVHDLHAETLFGDTPLGRSVLGTLGMGRLDEGRYAAAVLDAAVGGGMSSRLFQEIREKRGLVFSVGSSLTHYAGTGSFSVYAGCSPKRVPEVLRLIREELVRVADEGLTAEEVARGRGQLKGGLVLGLEDTGSRMSRLGKSELSYGEYLPVREVLARLDAVDEQQVRAVAADLLTRPMCLAVVGPYRNRDLDALLA